VSGTHLATPLKAIDVIILNITNNLLINHISKADTKILKQGHNPKN